MLTNIQDSTFVFEVKGDVGYKYEQIKSKIDLDNGSLIYLPVLFIALFAAGIIMGIIHKGLILTDSGQHFQLPWFTA